MKKALSLALSIFMLISLTIPAFALTPEDAAKDLGKYGIMGGFPDGSLRLEQNVTRAQMTKMLVTTMGYEESEIGGFNPFSDVPATHWAKNYIAFSYNQHIIGGFGNGTFKPEDNVTTNQAIKMVVCMLSYDKYWLTDGTRNFSAGSTLKFPEDYLSAAASYGLIERDEMNPLSTTPATRGFVASLISKALDLPIAKANGYGEGGTSYAFMDGNDGRELITLRSILEQ